MTDLLQRLEAARPTQTELDEMWTPQERDAVLARILQQQTDPQAESSTKPDAQPQARHRRRQWFTAAAAIVGLALVTTVVDTGQPAAAEQLRALAVRAAAADGPTIAPGTFLHVSKESYQKNSALFGDGKEWSISRDSWIRWDGTMWAIDAKQSSGRRDYNVFERPKKPYYALPTPEFAASLPDEPGALRRHLDEHVTGSDSHEEAVFTAITDLARSHLLPPDTWAAALEVLADVDGVQTEDSVVNGRAAVEVTYRQHWGGLLGSHVLLIDRETGQVLAEETSNPLSTYRSETTLVEVVDEMPAEVLDTFERVGDGGRVWVERSG